jgi:ketosteroid isomerase-like protein
MKLVPTLFLSILLFTLTGCKTNKNEDARNHILAVEKAFNQMAAEQGVKEAFLEFAADSAVLNRGGSIIKGKSEIESYFDSQTMRDVRLEWMPEFVDVAESGDLGYTYGPFTFFGISAEGDTIQSSGIFHTVWEKQDDGSWKYVYD